MGQGKLSADMLSGRSVRCHYRIHLLYLRSKEEAEKIIYDTGTIPDVFRLLK